MIKKFETQVQYLKYKVLREVSRHAWEGDLIDHVYNIPKVIVPGPKPSMRCCIYMERAIVEERIKLAMGGNKDNKNMVEVIEIACDKCPVGGYEVTASCRGCIAHRCQDACHRDAISFVNQKAVIDKDKCVNCGLCAKNCPYSAIQNFNRPCQNACKVKAISIKEENKAALIDESKCVQCGACVYQCPFGAIMDKSFILDAIKILKESENCKNYKVYAVVAPSISAQFVYASVGKIITAMKMIGFHTVVEAALGADMVALEESKELAEKKFLTSSCCPAFVMYINKHFPTLIDKISHNLSPMAMISKYIKEIDPTSKVIFIGPCIAKKAEIQLDSVKKYVDCVLTFEELQALIDSRDIDLSSLEEGTLDNASYFGRIFARSGGLAEAVKEALFEQNIDFDLKAISADGIDNCKMQLLKAKMGNSPYNFIEGMACVGGCIGGPCCLTHEFKDKNEVDKYGKLSKEQTIKDAVNLVKLGK